MAAVAVRPDVRRALRINLSCQNSSIRGLVFENDVERLQNWGVSDSRGKRVAAAVRRKEVDTIEHVKDLRALGDTVADDYNS